jgi:hypothetical protein
MAGHVALTELCGAADECDDREIIIGRYKLLDTARSSGPASEKEGHDEYRVVQNFGGGAISAVTYSRCETRADENLIGANMNKVMRIFSVIILALLAACFASSAWAVNISGSKSTVVAVPTTVIADGVSTSTITVSVKKNNGGSSGSGIVVTLTAGSGNSVITTSPATTNGSGVATFTVTDTVVESVTYTAVAGGVTITQKPVVKFALKAPTVAKSFSPTTIAANGTSTLTITLTNPNTASIMGATFTDTFPASLVTSGAASTTCAGGTATAGGTNLTLSGATIPASGSCTVTVGVTSTTASAGYANTIAIGAVTSTNAAANTATASATLVVTAISATNSTVVASPTTVLADGVSISTITVTLYDGAATPGLVSGKTVTLSASSGSSVITLVSNVGGVATFTVKDATAQAVTYTAKDTTDVPNIVVTQTATVTFVNQAILKSFSTSPIAANGTSTLTVQLTNSAGSSVSGFGFTDTYPAGLVNAGNASELVPAKCGAGALTGTTGGNTLGLASTTIPATSTCTVNVLVTSATAGTYSNTATNLTTTASSAASLVVKAISAINSTVSANPASPASVPADGTSTSTITVTLKDGAAVPNLVSGKTVTLTAGSGSSTITTVTGVTNAFGQATFTVKDSTAETIIYTATDTTDSITVSTTASVTFSRLTAPTVTKSFNPSTIADNGTSTLTVTMTNPNTAAINGVAFKDDYTLDTGLGGGGPPTNTSTPGLSNTCGGSNPTTVANGMTLDLSGGTIPASGSCSVSVQVTANNTTASTSLSIVNSTGAVTSSNATSGTAATATLTDIGVDPVKSTVVAVPTSVPADNITTSTITVTLLDGGSNPVVGDTVTLTAGSGSSTITAIGLAPDFTPGVSDVNGQAFFTVRDGVVQSVTYTATDTTDSITIAKTATVTFGTALSSINPFNAFDSTSVAGTTIGGYIMTKISGAAFSLDVVALTSAPAVFTGFTGTVKVELVDSSSGACATYANIQTLAPNPTFIASDNGRHRIASITEPNAWKNVRVRVSYPVVSPTIVSCSNDNFAIRPNGFAILVQDLNRTTAGTANTLNTTTIAGTPVHNAGQPFTVQATALNAAAVTTTNYTGTQVIVPSACVNNGTTITGCATLGTFSIGTWSAAGAGAYNSSTATYSEVGAFTLQMKDQNFASVDAAANSGAGDGTPADCTGQYVCSSVNVGRFVPDHFDTAIVAASGVPMPCPTGLTCPTLYNGFVYSGQSFTTNVIARNLAGATTTNYDSGKGLSKAITLTAWDALGSTTTLNPPVATPGSISSGGTIASTSFSGGTTVSPGTPATPIYTFGTTSTNPTDIYIRAADTDGVTSLRVPANTSVEGGIKVVSGRIKIANAHGSELLSLSITVTVQYWNGNYVTSVTDSATQFDTKLSTAGGDVQATITNGPLALANVSVVTPGLVTFVNGVKTFKLGAPNVAGSADLTIITAPSYLLPSTTGRATFGVYKGANGLIYLRENY